MSSENKAWDSVKDGYLSQVEKALSSVKHPRKKEVLSDVGSHLERRFAELGPEEQTWENFQTIITEMGPASDYAELLEPNGGRPRQRVREKYILWGGIGIAAVVIIVLARLLPMFLGTTAGYIVKFEPVAPFGPRTAQELLNAFNSEVEFRVTTHHFRTEVKGGMLIGYICTNTEADKVAMAAILGNSKKLKLVSIEAASSKELEKHYLLGQPSLKDGGKRPLVLSTVPAAFDDSVSAELKEITVTFDRPMMNLSWAWVGSGQTFPEKTGEPRYDKSKTSCSLPVKLETGRFYWIGINSPRFKNFQTDMGVAAQPYVILFATKDKDGNATAIPDNFLEEAKEVNSLHDKRTATKSTP